MPHTNEDRREEILEDSLDIHGLEDIRHTFTTKPLRAIYDAMDENGKRMCLELLEYMAKNKVRCGFVCADTREDLFEYNGKYINKEQLFENFL